MDNQNGQPMTLKAYKGFDKDLKCRGFQYEIGGEYKTDAAECCEKGFHACEAPLDVLKYYPLGSGSRYCEVEQSGDLSRNSGDDSDTKVASTEIKIGAEIGIPGLVKAHVEWVKSQTAAEYTGGDESAVSGGDESAVSGGDRSAVSGGYRSAVSGGDSSAVSGGYRSAVSGGDSSAVSGGDSSAVSGGDESAVSGGDRSAVSGGDRSAVSGGYRSAVSGGDSSAVSGGDSSAVSGGDSSAVSGGDRSAVSGGDRSAVSGGDRSAVSGGDESAVVSRGTSSIGINGIALARGNDVKVKGGMGAILALAEECAGSYDIRHWKAFVVDGETYKPDVWYKLSDAGEVIEAWRDEAQERS